MLSLKVLEGGEKGLGLLDRKAFRPQVVDERPLLGDVHLALPDVPPDHREF